MIAKTLCTLIFVAVSFLLHAKDKLQQQEQLQVIFDTDMGPDYDDVGAMAVLHSLADEKLLSIKAVVSSNGFNLTAPTIQILNEYFKRPEIPVGIPSGKALNLQSPFYWNEYLVTKYPIKKQQYTGAVTLYRKVLAAAEDNSITIITVGFLTNLSDLLESNADSISNLSGLDLIKKKVKNLYCMGGKFPKGSEYNINRDPRSSRNVAENWPTDIYFLGFELGAKILTGKELLTNYSITNSPVKDVNIILIPQRVQDAQGRMSWDQATVLAAVDHDRTYFDMTRGVFRVDGKSGANTWQNDEKGNHYYFTPKASIAEITTKIKQLMYR